MRKIIFALLLFPMICNAEATTESCAELVSQNIAMPGAKFCQVFSQEQSLVITYFSSQKIQHIQKFHVDNMREVNTSSIADNILIRSQSSDDRVILRPDNQGTLVSLYRAQVRSDSL